MALRCHPRDTGLRAPASRHAETQTRREGWLCRLDICCPERSPIPVGGAPALPNLPTYPGPPPGPPLSPMSPGAMASGSACSTGVLWVMREGQLSCCFEGFGGCPRSGSSARCCQSQVCVPVLPLLGAPQGSYPGASSVPSALPAPGARDAFRAHGLVLQRVSRCAGVPVPPRGCSPVRLRRPCPACALNCHHTSPL